MILFVRLLSMCVFCCFRLKHSDSHSEMASVLLETFLQLRQTSQSMVVEALHYAYISEEGNSSILATLQDSVSQLQRKADVRSNRVHVLVIKETSIISIYSGQVSIYLTWLLIDNKNELQISFRKGASELKVDDIFFLIIACNAFARSESLDGRMIILESCVPYTAHLHKLGNAYFVLFLIEVL